MRTVRKHSANPIKYKYRCIFRCVSFALLFALGAIYSYIRHDLPSSAEIVRSDAAVGPVRSLLESEQQHDAAFPKALASGDEWLLIFLFPGILYMFLALAIICDEYFVPALEIICDEDNLNLSDDVAGATFMAAGGSAPELFTSFIGTMQDSAVGFGTIVGSAVFNVVFVIAMCAFFSKELLTLTWWPLARDSTYYTFSLLMLALFFGGISENEIEWWEALTLLAMYGGYVVLMIYNEKLQELAGYVPADQEEDSPRQEKAATCDSPSGQVQLTGVGLDPSQCAVTINGANDGSESESKMLTPKSVNKGNPAKHDHVVFHRGIVSLVLGGQHNFAHRASVHVVSKLEGDAYETFNNIAPECDGAVPTLKICDLFQEMDIPATEEEVEKFSKQLDLNSDGFISWEEFKIWYNDSEDRVHAEMVKAFDKVSNVSMIEDPNCIDAVGLQAVLQELGGSNEFDQAEFEEILDSAIAAIPTNDEGLIERTEFYKWFQSSMFWTKKNANIVEEGDEAEEEEDEEEFVEPLVWPSEESTAVKAYWIVCLPLNVLFVYTCPNCQREGDVCGRPNKSWCWVAFVLSICWIGAVSFVMVEWTVIAGDTLSIPAQVMGLTFLAAGTSVPDLLSSVVVAQQGKGDMAVSSSIGSNIFDVLIGLPLPWLSYCVIKQKSVLVGAKSLQLSILILVGMLVSVIIIIKVCGWALTKGLGAAMLVLYFLFVIQDLLRDETLICNGGCF